MRLIAIALLLSLACACAPPIREQPPPPPPKGTARGTNKPDVVIGKGDNREDKGYTISALPFYLRIPSYTQTSKRLTPAA